MLTRNCPQCQNIIDYSHEHTRNKAEIKGSRCASCRNHRDLKLNCECKICHKKLYRRPSKTKGNIFCTNGCRNKYYSGERWNQKSKLKRDRSGDRRNIIYKKQRAVDYKGGKCENCGYCKCIAALDFHHKNPEEKMYEIKGLMNRKWDLIKSEIDKCMLLCSNCHRELHWEDRNEKRRKMGNSLQ